MRILYIKSVKLEIQNRSGCLSRTHLTADLMDFRDQLRGKHKRINSEANTNVYTPLEHVKIIHKTGKEAFSLLLLLLCCH